MGSEGQAGTPREKSGLDIVLEKAVAPGAGYWDEDSVKLHYLGDEILPVDMQKTVDRVWSGYLKSHPAAYDGTLCKLVDLVADAGKLHLYVQATKYSRYISSRTAADELPRRGYRANPLGMTALVTSEDGHYLITRRSLDNEQNPGGYYSVGGYPELNPRDEGVLSLMEEMLREAREEIGVEVAQIGSLRLLGLRYDLEFFHPEAFFFLSTTLPSAQLLEQARGHASSEMADYRLCDIDELVEMARDDMRATWSLRIAVDLLTKAGLGPQHGEYVS